VDGNKGVTDMMRDDELDLLLEQDAASQEREVAMYEAASQSLRDSAPEFFEKIRWQIIGEWKEWATSQVEDQEIFTDCPIPPLQKLIRVLGVDPDYGSVWMEVGLVAGGSAVIFSGTDYDAGGYDQPAFREDILWFFPMEKISNLCDKDGARLVAINGMRYPSATFEWDKDGETRKSTVAFVN
jgi:hypothetical protein